MRMSVDDNVDRRLLAHFEAAWAHERARRELLPPAWINAEPAPDDDPGDLVADVIERARDHVRAQREALDAGIIPVDGQSQA
jgi:hypothetical protein